MKGPTIIACYYLICQTFGKITYEGNQLWKIKNDNYKAIELINFLERNEYLTLWGKTSTTVDAMIKYQYLEKVKRTLIENNLPYQVSIQDIQKAIDQQNPPSENRRNHQLTWQYYHRLEDIYEYLHYLAETFPQVCSLHTIGLSVEGRAILLLRITNRRQGNKAIFVEGGAHAREWISPAAVTYIINQIIYNEPKLLQGIDWYFVPVLNPDGYEYTHTYDRLWRKNKGKYGNCMGVDLNRNWSYDWGKNGSSDDPCSHLYRGPRPFSEPETVAVANILSQKNINWNAFISIHSYGQYILYPWSSSSSTLEDSREIDGLGLRAASEILMTTGTQYTVGPGSTTIYSASGTSIDWTRGTRGIKYSYTVELRDRGRYGFLLPSNYIEPTSVEALILVKTIADSVLS